MEKVKKIFTLILVLGFLSSSVLAATKIHWWHAFKGRLGTLLAEQVDQFNAQQDFERNKWNATNQAMIEQSNVEWRRRANTIDTAAQNQINMQNAMNSFKLSGASLSNYWQQLRDEAA